MPRRFWRRRDSVSPLSCPGRTVVSTFNTIGKPIIQNCWVGEFSSANFSENGRKNFSLRMIYGRENWPISSPHSRPHTPQKRRHFQTCNLYTSPYFSPPLTTQLGRAKADRYRVFFFLKISNTCGWKMAPELSRISDKLDLDFPGPIWRHFSVF